MTTSGFCGWKSEMGLILFLIIAILVAVTSASLANTWANTSSVLKGCSYTSTCSVGGINGICGSKSSGCCTGTMTAGYCAGSADVQCCTSALCSTPSVRFFLRIIMFIFSWLF